LRLYAYMDESQSERLGLAGVVNTVSLLPAEGVSGDDVKRALLPIPGVAAVQPVSAASESFEKAISQIADILRITEVVALALALLIAFNTATINADERRREHATMFAFGVRPRTVLRLAMVESVLVGLVATGIGIGLGILVILYVTSVLTPQVLPELGTIVWVAPGTIGLAVLLGVAAVALAPLLTWRRLSRMDVPSTLRVVE
jgi:putative ABC transport system permease protein